MLHTKKAKNFSIYGMITASFLLFALSLSCCTNSKAKEADSPVNEATQVTVYGFIRQIGNEPHIELVLSGTPNGETESHEYYLIGDKAKLDSSFAGQKICVTGLSRKVELRLAGTSGKTRTRYFLEVQTIEIVTK